MPAPQIGFLLYRHCSDVANVRLSVACFFLTTIFKTTLLDLAGYDLAKFSCRQQVGRELL